MTDGDYFPAEPALAGECDLLVGMDTPVFPERTQTINLRTEVPGPPPYSSYLSYDPRVAEAGARWVWSKNEYIVCLPRETNEYHSRQVGDRSPKKLNRVRATQSPAFSAIYGLWLENKRSTVVGPVHTKYKVGPGGIELRRFHLSSPAQAARKPPLCTIPLL